MKNFLISICFGFLLIGSGFVMLFFDFEKFTNIPPEHEIEYKTEIFGYDLKEYNIKYVILSGSDNVEIIYDLDKKDELKVEVKTPTIFSNKIYSVKSVYDEKLYLDYYRSNNLVDALNIFRLFYDDLTKKQYRNFIDLFELKITVHAPFDFKGKIHFSFSS